MSKKYRPRGYWANKENVLADARKYAYFADWARASGGAIGSAKKHGWLAEACQHMTSPHKPRGHWTLAALIADARQYSSPSAWKENNASAYATARTKGWLGLCSEHMARIRHPVGYWTKEKCIQSARRYSTIIAWSLAEGPAYDAAKRGRWYREATKHMVKTYSHGEYTIYRFLLQHDIVFEHQKRFGDLRDKKHLPYDFYLPAYNLAIEYQGRQHFNVSPNSMFSKDLSAMQRRDALKRKYAENARLSYLEIEAQTADDIEAVLVAKLTAIQQSRGQLLVLEKRALTEEEDRALAHLGTWTKEAVLADALKYQSRRDWANCGNAASQIARLNGWAEEATRHMTQLQKPAGYWTKDRVLADAKQYKTKLEWVIANGTAWGKAQARGWLAEATAHMTNPPTRSPTPPSYWTKERVLADATQYKTRMEWFRGSNSAYRKAQASGWLAAATVHMPKRAAKG